MKRKPRILIDLSPLGFGYCGLWEYSYRFGITLEKLYDEDEFELTYLLPEKHPFDFKKNIKFKHISFFDRYLKCRINEHDLIHTVRFPSPFMPSNSFKGVLIATIHDLNFLYEKSDAKIKKYKRRFQKSLKNVKQSVCISNHALNDAEKHLKISCPVKVIYNGVHIDDADSGNNFEPFVESPFLFSVSTFMRKKNFHVLIPFLAKLPDYKLIIAGRIIHKSYFNEVKSLVNKYELNDRVIFMKEITESEKRFLYSNCTAFVFPSVVEGFGIPPIEAMSYGKPVFVSNRTSVPEICGKPAFYWTDFDPDKMCDIFNKGMSIFNNDPTYPELLKKQASKYSWTNTVMDYLNLYRRHLT